MSNPLVHLGQHIPGKDSRWLTLEVCREHQRNKCSRSDEECKFAHPLPNVEVTNGRVVCCYDSIKGKCQRKEPPCKYLHPPQHLREQLLQNGRNNLILKNIQMQVFGQNFTPPNGMVPLAAEDSLNALMLSCPSPFVPPAASTGSYSILAQPTPSPLNIQPYLTSVAGIPSPSTGAFTPFINNAAAMSFLFPTVGNCAVTPVSFGDLLLAPNMYCATTNSFQDMNNSVVSSVTSHKPTTVSLGGRSADGNLYEPRFTLNEIMKAPKRTLEAGNDLFALNMGMQHPYGVTAAPKRPAVADTKSGLPVYQPPPIPMATLAAYHQALANSRFQLQHTMQHQPQTHLPAAFAAAAQISSEPRF